MLLPPLPETVPSRKDARVTARPAPARLLPIHPRAKSTKNFPAPEISSTAPKIVNRMINVEETSTGVPKRPFNVIHSRAMMRVTVYPRCPHGSGR